MRRYAKALLLMLVALLYAGTAAAHTMTAAGPTSAAPTDIITVDIVMDNEGANIYGYLTNVYFDPAVLSAVSGVQNLLGGEGSYGITENPDNWYAQGTWWAAAGPFNASVMTLVFHVMDVPATTYTDIVPVTYIFDAGLGTIVTATGVPLSIHVPEPTTTMLMGLGLLGILYAGRRR
jgi:hypothetical protein